MPHYLKLGSLPAKHHVQFPREKAASYLGEGLHYANSKQNDQSYQTGYDKGRSDAVKQQYWLYVSMQQARTGNEGRVRLYQVHLPEQVIDGVIFKPTTQLLRIEGGGASTQ